MGCDYSRQADDQLNFLALVRAFPNAPRHFRRTAPSLRDRIIKGLGDREGIQQQTKTWDKFIMDRAGDLAE